eukprot:365296-Chlamydomonas_euryale.AAC.20
MARSYEQRDNYRLCPIFRTVLGTYEAVPRKCRQPFLYRVKRLSKAVMKYTNTTVQPFPGDHGHDSFAALQAGLNTCGPLSISSPVDPASPPPSPIPKPVS